jgi:uncharacterized membrane protein
MKPLLNFARATLIGGLLFLVPIVALIILLGKALALAHKFVDPLAAQIPFESVFGLRTPLLLAIGLLVLFCFLAGFFARTALARKIVRGLEDTVLSKVPGYAFLKGMSESMLGVEQGSAFPAVLVRFDDAWQIGLQVDVLEHDLVAVYVPGAPAANAGAVYFMNRERVAPVNLPMSAALKCLKQFGVGSRALLRDVCFRTAAGR